jgi:hypothetical protein
LLVHRVDLGVPPAKADGAQLDRGEQFKRRLRVDQVGE